MKSAQKPGQTNLYSLVQNLRKGEYVIPDFQREFEWSPTDVSQLMRSIFLDYYIGSLLLWRGKSENFENLACEALYGFAGDRDNQKYIVLDGQQRLTAMHYAFLAPDVRVPKRKSRAFYFIDVVKFMEESPEETFVYKWANKSTNALMADQEAQFAAHLFPLSVVGASSFALQKWLSGYQEYWTKHADDTDLDDWGERAGAFAKRIEEVVMEYEVSWIELDEALSLDKICDIFTQINSRGIRLDVFDLMNAFLKPKGIQLKHLWREAEPELEFADADKMNVYVLQVMSILRQSYCSPKYLYYLLPGEAKPGKRGSEILVPDEADFKRRWEQAVRALKDSLTTLRHAQDYGVISAKYLPYVSILPAFAALQEAVRLRPAETRLSAQRKVRHWYWASIFTGRYSGSVESKAARDFIDVSAWLEDDAAKPPMIDELEQRFRTLDLRKEVRQGTSTYNGIFNLLVIQGARDWITGHPPRHDDLDDHHIVPASWGRKNVKGKAFNSILNRTPLSADTNRNIISDKLPNEYLPIWIEKNGEERVRETLASHFISPDAQEILLRNPFTPDDFDDFLAERQRTLTDAIETLLIKERLDLAPRLRELDERIEKVELGIRDLVAEVLNDDPARLPSHVGAKIAGRLKSAAQANKVDSADYVGLKRQLEFSDLRELQDAIASKASWAEFEPYLRNKDALNTKFTQLAALRNSIRHSRSVDAIERQEGEASLMWFERIFERGATAA